MPENPLLPNRKLQELYALMQRSRALDLKQARKAGGKQKARLAREAVLAATSMHLLPGDLLSAEPGDRAVEQLAPAAKSAAAISTLAAPALASRLLLCAAAARGLQTAAAEGIVLAYASAGPPDTSNTGWAAALEWAHTAQLPLLLTCFGTAPASSTPRRSQLPNPKSGPPLRWDAIQQLAKHLRLPLLPVDGEDAVAVYRVMQECALRARQGGGPAVLWAILSAPTGPGGLPRARQPIPRLKTYLDARGITPS